MHARLIVVLVQTPPGSVSSRSPISSSVSSRLAAAAWRLCAGEWPPPPAAASHSHRCTTCGFEGSCGLIFSWRVDFRRLQREAKPPKSSCTVLCICPPILCYSTHDRGGTLAHLTRSPSFHLPFPALRDTRCKHRQPCLPRRGQTPPPSARDVGPVDDTEACHVSRCRDRAR